MRVIFDEELKAVADDLDRMVQDVRKAINGAGDALLKQDIEAAQSVIDGDIEIDALESSVIDQCIRLLAKQNPVATDLRVVVSTLRLAATFERMGDLAKHIAEAARRIYPEPALPAEATELFTEMQQFLSMTADRIVVMLQDRDAKTAEEIILDDDKNKALFINIFGGITRCDEVAGGIRLAKEQYGINKLIIIRFEGTNKEKGLEIIQGLENVVYADGLIAGVDELVKRRAQL